MDTSIVSTNIVVDSLAHIARTPLDQIRPDARANVAEHILRREEATPVDVARFGSAI